MVATLTSKGQLTVPKSVRKKLNLQSGDKIEFVIDCNGEVKIIPVKSSLKSLKGMAPNLNKTVSLEEMQTAIQEEGSKL